MMLKEKQRELEMHISGEAHKLEHRLVKEMSACFAELQSLVQICMQRAEGQDPNISVLLGLKGRWIIVIIVGIDLILPNISVLLGLKGGWIVIVVSVNVILPNISVLLRLKGR